ncbi:TIGR01459 family HAD-type hydrolase [Sphingomicrobium marinum]|uniref:TIGR01459 family HAD-type hydrolase n=1 Tax=Sphingomicrobium marinum TaxID=1227950 RepID=UPI00223FECC0|nr:TIGR01459 family HAD-type hydrolase [Sphingomicrobium marinum]
MTLDELPERYSTILCDVWGVIHDGARLYPGVERRFARWRDEGRTVVLVTNAPRPADRVISDLDLLGLDRDLYAAVTSSGQAGIAAVTEPPRAVGFCGTRDDFADLEEHGVRFAAAQEPHDEIALIGLDEYRNSVREYESDLAAWRERGMLLHCFNPDRIVVHRGQRLVCAGALADAYEGMGGKVIWYGKPNAPIFDHAIRLAGSPDRDSVVMIGDGPHTDMLGAKNAGIDGIFVTGGINEGDSHQWGAEFENWRPIMTIAQI